MRLLQASSLDMDASCTASAHWPCIARGSNYFNIIDSSLVVADTGIDLVSCKVTQLTDGLNFFSVSLGVNHAVVEVLALIMD